MKVSKKIVLRLLIVLNFSILIFANLGIAEIKKTNLDLSLQIAKSRCPLLSPPPTTLQNSDFKWNISLFEMKRISDHIYQSPKRLSKSMYYDPQQKVFKIPFRNGKDVAVTDNFIKNTILHIEVSLQKKYAEYINFSDMGHNHFLIPNDFYKKHIANMPISEWHLMYEKIMSHKKTKFIYHTAEQLSLHKEIIIGDDSYLRYRYLNRNVIGDNELTGHLEILRVQNPLKTFNTISNVEGYRWWSGIYMSANKEACIPYKKQEETYYFDINFDGLNENLENL